MQAPKTILRQAGVHIRQLSLYRVSLRFPNEKQNILIVFEIDCVLSAISFTSQQHRLPLYTHSQAHLKNKFLDKNHLHTAYFQNIVIVLDTPPKDGTQNRFLKDLTARLMRGCTLAAVCASRDYNYCCQNTQMTAKQSCREK